MTREKKRPNSSETVTYCFVQSESKMEKHREVSVKKLERVERLERANETRPDIKYSYETRADQSKPS